LRVYIYVVKMQRCACVLHLCVHDDECHTIKDDPEKLALRRACASCMSSDKCAAHVPCVLVRTATVCSLQLYLCAAAVCALQLSLHAADSCAVHCSRVCPVGGAGGDVHEHQLPSCCGSHHVGFVSCNGSHHVRFVAHCKAPYNLYKAHRCAWGWCVCASSLVARDLQEGSLEGRPYIDHTWNQTESFTRGSHL